MSAEMDDIINSFILQDYYQRIIESESFYFDELKKLYDDYKKFDIAPFKTKIQDFIDASPGAFKFQELLDGSKGAAYHDFLLLLGKMISIFDEKGYNTAEWNPYQDKRRVSRAQFTQRNWTYCFFKYKLNSFS